MEGKEAEGICGCVRSVRFHRVNTHIVAHRGAEERGAVGPVSEAAISVGPVQLLASQDSFCVCTGWFCLLFREVRSWW